MPIKYTIVILSVFKQEKDRYRTECDTHIEIKFTFKNSDHIEKLHTYIDQK